MPQPAFGLKPALIPGIVNLADRASARELLAAQAEESGLERVAASSQLHLSTPCYPSERSSRHVI